MGFTASEADPGVFIAHYKGGKVFVLVYVDDILVADKSLTDIQHVKDRLTDVFKVRDLDEAKYFLGMSLDRNWQALNPKDDSGASCHRACEQIWHEGGLQRVSQ